MSTSDIRWLNCFLLNRYIKWQAGFPRGNMQHVNMCLQALCKRFQKSCREQEKEEEKDARCKKHWKWEPASPWAQCDRWQHRVFCPRQPPLNNNHPSVLSVSSSFLRARGKEHDTSCLTLPVWSATTGHPLVHKIQSIGDGWVSRAGVWSINGIPYFQSPPPLYHGAFVPSSQTSRPETR